MANLIDTVSGDKVDFWLLTETPFDYSRFTRRYHEELMGMRIAVSSPEDTILMKLRWSKMSGGSEKQFIDALRVYEVSLQALPPFPSNRSNNLRNPRRCLSESSLRWNAPKPKSQGIPTNSNFKRMWKEKCH